MTLPNERYIFVYMNNINVKFNNKYLSNLMGKAKVSPGKLSQELVLRGVSCTYSTVKLWQDGKAPRVETLYVLSVIFGVKMENFLSVHITKSKEMILS